MRIRRQHSRRRPAAVHLAAGLGNVPAEPNSFVGRGRDLAELSRQLRDVRVLTLCGPGGIGKSRLAVRLGHQLADSFGDGVWLVELADTADPPAVPARVAAVLGVRAERDRALAATLADALRPRELLLILDTCEHLLDACATLAHDLVTSCPLLRVLATSREPLRIRGETVWRVPPLELPPAPTGLAVEQLAGSEAVRLFADRAAAVRPAFAIGPENAADVARLCRLLDGVPLAIELAAARARALSVAELAQRLGDRFQLLVSGDRTAPPRQQTLLAAVGWSYDLLTEPEQLLLRRLSVFSGWNLEMAERVCADGQLPAGQVLGLLAALIDKSLVTLDAELQGAARYRLLDTIRDYAAALLAGSAEQPALRRRHSNCLLQLAERTTSAAFVRGDPPWPERVTMYHRIVAELPNFRAALSWCLADGRAEEGLRICSALRALWVAYGDLTEGAGWFDSFLSMPGPAAPGVRARALMLRAELAFEQQDYRAAAASAQAGLDLAPQAGRAGGLRVLALVSLRDGRCAAALASADQAIAAARADADDWELGLALGARAAIVARTGRFNEALRIFDEALDVLRDNNGWGVAVTLSGLGTLAIARQDYPAALRCFDSALTLYRQIEARPEIARCLAGIGWVWLLRRDVDLAAASLTESLQLSLATGQRLAIGRGLEAFAVVAAEQGDPARAIRLEGAALALRGGIRPAPSSPIRSRLSALLESARQELGEPAMAALLAEGSVLTADEAVRYATGTQPGQPTMDGLPPPASLAALSRLSPPGRPYRPPNPALTPRQYEVAELIARGLSNRAIAAELVISPATVARHVAEILRRLGLRSRAQVAAWAAERERPPT